MATTSIKPVVPKSSFAKVAALNANQRPSPVVGANSMSSVEMTDPSSMPKTSVSPVPAVPSMAGRFARSQGGDGVKASSSASDMQRINEAVKSLKLKDEPLSVTSRSSDDGVPHTSPSEASSRRPASLDGKSTISGTTFALDEKESLRPDDSASVMAAEEEDSFSAPGSVAPGSRPGSETGARAFRDQFHEISERIGDPSDGQALRSGPSTQPHPLSNTAKPTDLASPAVVAGATSGASAPAVPFGFTQSGPDEKLLEALESPKDRLFLLRLEQDVVEFVKDSKEPMLDLPPCNSFCRLLIHKLADYYFLTHFVDPAANSIRIYRTPFCRLPPPLTGITNPPLSGTTPPPTAQAMKIMRRGMSDRDNGKGDRNNRDKANSSAAASDDGGDLGGEDGKMSRTSTDPGTGGWSKDKSNMTREEREIAYREARERIFKGFEAPESDETSSAAAAATTGVSSRELSRSSSRNDRSKTAAKRTKNAKDDGFEARSQFAPYYPPPQYQVPSFGGAPPYGPPAPYHADFAPAIPGPHVTYPTPAHPPPLANGSPSHVGYGPQGPMPMPRPPYSPVNMPPTFPPTMPPPPPNFGHHTLHHSAGPDPQWSAPFYHSPYPAQNPQLGQIPPSNMAQPGSSPGKTTGINPYPYGQLPSLSYPQHVAPRNPQHPIPGSFNRNVFNPRTQSFVPGGGPYGAEGMSGPAMPGVEHPHGHHGSPPFRMPMQAMQSMHATKYPSPSHHLSPQASSAQVARKGSSSRAAPPTKPAAMQSTLSKWGTPPNLPPKPPAPASSSHIDPQRNLPPAAFANGIKPPLPMNVGPGSTTTSMSPVNVSDKALGRGKFSGNRRI
ncbi:MAG: hypothetical protein M1838_003823 [Thelocarpon superellum]|nr:MAG: hypothetical protein M1838_003823 [Thelocarpon superellum]